MKRLIVLFVGALAIGACAAGPSGSSSAPATASPNSATNQGASLPPERMPIIVKDFTLEPKDVTVTTSTALDVTNEGPTIHNITIRDSSGAVSGATKDLRTGESDVLSLSLQPGAYVIYCSLPGHESLGIKGTLTVAR